MILAPRKGWIGVDFGTRALKLAQVERAGAGLRVAASAVMPRTGVSGDSPSSGAQGWHWSGADLLAALSLNAGFSGRRAACTLPMRFTELHTLAIPPGGEGERRAMIAHELASMRSAGEQDRQFDFWETEPSPAGDLSANENVNVLSVSPAVLARAVENLGEAKLNCQVMDGLPFALARAVQLASSAALSVPVGALHWGFTSATFCVVSDGTPRFTRHLRTCGFASLTEAVREALGVSEDEAVGLLLREGLPSLRCQDARRREIQTVIAEVTANALNEIVEELTRTLSYLRMQYRHLLPERICLLGDGAVLGNVAAVWSDKTGVPVETWQLPLGENHRRHDPEPPPAIFATAVALSALAWSS